MNKATKMMIILGCVMATLSAPFKGFGGSGSRSSTPNMPYGKGHRERHKVPVVPGKWRMKAHRSRR